MANAGGDLNPFEAVVARNDLAAARASARRHYLESDRDTIRRLARVLELARRKVGIEPSDAIYDFAGLARRILIAAKKTPLPREEYALVYRIWALLLGQSDAFKARAVEAAAATPAAEAKDVRHDGPRKAKTLEEAAANGDCTYNGARALSWLSEVLHPGHGVSEEEVRKLWEEAKAKQQASSGTLR